MYLKSCYAVMQEQGNVPHIMLRGDAGIGKCSLQISFYAVIHE